MSALPFLLAAWFVSAAVAVWRGARVSPPGCHDPAAPTERHAALLNELARLHDEAGS